MGDGPFRLDADLEQAAPAENTTKPDESGAHKTIRREGEPSPNAAYPVAGAGKQVPR